MARVSDVADLCNLFLEMMVKINFNNYLLLNKIELVHVFFMFTNKHISYYLMTVRKLYGPGRLFKQKIFYFCKIEIPL